MPEFIEITSKDNPLIKFVSNLQSSSKYRNKEGLFVPEGLRICDDAYQNNIKFDKLIVTKDAYNKHKNIIDNFVSISKNCYFLREDLFKKISDTKKIVTFIKKGEEDKTLYSWIVDGTKKFKISEFKPNIDFNFKNLIEFDEIVGYRKGFYLQLANGTIPNSTLQVNVSSQYKNGEKVHVYFYDEAKKEIQLFKQSLEVKEGTISFPLTKGGQYFVSKAVIEGTSTNYFKIVAIGELIALAISGGYIVFLKKKLIEK